MDMRVPDCRKADCVRLTRLRSPDTPVKLLLFLPLLLPLWFLGRAMRRSRSAERHPSEIGASGDVSGGYAGDAGNSWGDGYGGDGGDGGGDGGG